MKRFNPLASSCIALLAGLSLAACGSLSARPDPSRFFTLSPIPRTEATAAKSPDNPDRVSLGIVPVKLPGYLDRQEIVTRIAENRLDVSAYDRWAEPLEEGFTWVVAQNLAALVPADRLVAYPWALDRKPDYQVEIEVLRFEVNAAQNVQLVARWAVVDGSSKKPPAVKTSRLTRQVKSKSTEDSVAALSEAVADLSREIAEAARAIDGTKK